MPADSNAKRKRRLEKSFRTTETFIANGDDLTIWKFVGFFKRRRGCQQSSFLVQSQEQRKPSFSFDVTNNFTFRQLVVKGIATFGQDFHEIIGEITSCKIQTKDGMGEEQ